MKLASPKNERVRYMIRLHHQGKSSVQIARLLRVTVPSVERVIARWVTIPDLMRELGEARYDRDEAIARVRVLEPLTEAVCDKLFAAHEVLGRRAERREVVLSEADYCVLG